MAKTANEKILDSVFLRAVDLSRFEEKTKQEILKILRDIQNNVRKDLVDIKTDPTVPKTLRGKEARLIALQKQINLTINTGTAKIKRKMKSNLHNVAVNEGSFTERLLFGGIPVDAAVQLSSVAISPEKLQRIADDTLIDGFTDQEWWQSYGNDLKRDFKGAMREGIVRGEGIGALLSRVSAATAGAGLAGSAGFDKFQAHAKTLIRTSVSTVSNRAREAVYSANSDIISELQWLSTLDTRTSDICIVRDGKLYTVDTHEPIGHSYPWESGPGSIHYNCRSTSSPVLKSVKELGIDTSAQTRKSMDGKVPASTDYEGWLKTQSKKTQEKVLGVKKAELWRSGEVKNLRTLFDQTGRAKPLSELPKLQ
jgi:SPP1 gp7 family putative phage head morphogenesis protein